MSAKAARLNRAATSAEMLRSRTAACALTSSHSTGRSASVAAERGRQLLDRARRPGRAGVDRAGQLRLERVQPLAATRVEQLEQHRLAGLEVAQHVGLRQADPAAELVEA